MKCPNCDSSNYLSSDATGTFHCAAPLVERDRRGNVVTYEADSEDGQHKEGDPVLVGECGHTWKLGDEAWESTLDKGVSALD